MKSAKILFIFTIVMMVFLFACQNAGPPPQTYKQEVSFTIIISEDINELPHLKQKGGGAVAVTVWNHFHDTFTIEMLGTAWQGDMFDPNSEVLGHEVKHILHMKDPLKIVTVHKP